MRSIQEKIAGALSYTELRYVLVGGLSFLLNFALFYCCYTVLGWWYVYATIAAGSLAWLVNFPLHKWWTFGDRRREAVPLQAAAHFTLKLFNTYLWDPLLLYGLVEGLDLSPLWGKAVVGAVLGLQNYLLCRHLIFRPLPA